MTLALADHAEQIALSASRAAWAGAAASTFASVVALGVAAWGALREEGRRSRQVREQEVAFSFAMVGAMEMIKPLLNAARADAGGETARRVFVGKVDHARVIARAGLAIQVFDMQMLRDAYLLQGLLNALADLAAERPGQPVAHAAVRDIVEPVMATALEGDDRFFARLPPLAGVKGIEGRTPLQPQAA